MQKVYVRIGGTMKEVTQFMCDKCRTMWDTMSQAEACEKHSHSKDPQIVEVHYDRMTSYLPERIVVTFPAAPESGHQEPIRQVYEIRP